MNSPLVWVNLPEMANPILATGSAQNSFAEWALRARPEDGPIAIVDDDKWVLKSLERLLKCAGFNVQTFLSAEEFLDSGMNCGTSCVILDIGLPGLNGLDLQQRLAVENPQVRVIFVSAHDETEMRDRAFASGAVAFLGKPVDDRALLDAVSSAVK